MNAKQRRIARREFYRAVGLKISIRREPQTAEITACLNSIVDRYAMAFLRFDPGG